MASPLLPRVAVGETAAFRELVRLYGGFVHGVARRFLHDARDVEDACQETFLALWRSASTYDPATGDESAFVATIARRRVIDCQRSVRRSPFPPPSSPPPPLELHGPAAGAGAVERDVDARAAMALARELQDHDQQRVLIAALHGFTHEEIARDLAIPLGTVKSHYARAIEGLKRQLEPRRGSRRRREKRIPRRHGTRNAARAANVS